MRKMDSEAEQQRTRTWWDAEVEKRLEPGGLLILEGQRLGPNEHYRYCLTSWTLTRTTLLSLRVSIRIWMTRIVASTTTLCLRRIIRRSVRGARVKEPHHHPKTALPYPDGCLLDPRRLTYRDLLREQAENPLRFETVFQQNDTSPDTVLVPKHWIDGDDDHPGCWDRDRDAWELPELDGELITVVAVDPSPTKNWAVQAWAYHPSSESYFLLDLFRGAMTQPEFCMARAIRIRACWRRCVWILRRLGCRCGM